MTSPLLTDSCLCGAESTLLRVLTRTCRTNSVLVCVIEHAGDAGVTLDPGEKAFVNLLQEDNVLLVVLGH